MVAELVAGAVSCVTLGQPSARSHSDLGKNGEHKLAFVLIGVAFGFAYTRNRLLTSITSVVMIGVLEVLQLWVPGRHARFEDFVVDALAACAGLTVTAGIDRVMQRTRRANAV